MNALKKIDKGLVNISRVVLTVTVITEMVIVFSGVIARYVFNNSLAWVDELAGYLLLVITCFGCHIAYYEKSLAAVTVFVDRLPFALRKLFRTVANVSIVILMVLLPIVPVLSVLFQFFVLGVPFLPDSVPVSLHNTVSHIRSDMLH